jgi:hypothetical protein
MSELLRDRNEPWWTEQIPGKRRGLAPDGKSRVCVVDDDAGNYVHAEELMCVASRGYQRGVALDPPPSCKAHGHQ